MTLDRRQFLQVLASSGAGALAAGAPGLGCRGRLPPSLARPVECPGHVLGEAPSLGHRLRDHDVHLPPLGPAAADSPLRDVVVIGAGLSGLAAAWALRRAGVDDLVVLERSDAIGGVSRGGHVQGYPCPRGAHYIGLPDPDSPVLMHLLTDLGVIEGLTADGRPVIAPAHRVRRPEANIYHGQSWSRGFFSHGRASPADRAAFRSFLAAADRWSRWRDSDGRPAFQLPVAYASEAWEVRRLDEVSLASYVERHLGLRSSLLMGYLDDRMTDEYGGRADEVSAYAGMLFFAAEGGKRGAAPDPPSLAGSLTEYISWPEGNAFLARGLAAHLPPGALHTSAWVLDVRNAPGALHAAGPAVGIHGRGPAGHTGMDLAGEVHVTTLDPETGETHIHRGRTCIFAAPKLRADLVLPELAAAGRSEHLRLTFTPWLVGNVLLEDTPEHAAPALAWDNLVHGSWSLGFVNNHHFAAPGQDSIDPFVLSFYACFSGPLREPARQDLLSLDWQGWARLVVDELEQAMPEVRRSLLRLDLWRWGHAMVLPAPGVMTSGLRESLAAPLGRIFFAGTDVSVLPLYEEAVSRGVTAADQALAALGRPHRSLLGL